MMHLHVTIYLVFLLFATLVNCECSQPQSLINSDLSNDAFTAISYADEDHTPEQARLGSDECWCSMSLNGTGHSPWVQVKFDNLVEVIYVSVAGHDRFILSDEYIVNYNIQYGLNGGQLQYVINNDTGLPKVFPREGNDDPQVAQLPSPVITEVIRIVALPGSWNTDRACVQFQVYGCNAIPLNHSHSQMSTPSTLTQTMTTNTIIMLTSSTTLIQTFITDTITTTSSNIGSIVTATSNGLTIGTFSLPSVTAGPPKDNTQLIIISSSAAGGVVFVILILLIICLIVGVWGWRVQKQRKKNEPHENTVENDLQDKAIKSLVAVNDLPQTNENPYASIDALQYDYVRGGNVNSPSAVKNQKSPDPGGVHDNIPITANPLYGGMPSVPMETSDPRVDENGLIYNVNYI